jgi:hypothetical protein
MSAELDPKRLQLLHEIAPSLSRAAFLVNPNLTPGLPQRFTGAEAAAKSLGIALRRVDAATSADLTVAFAAIEESSSEALLVQSDPMLAGTEFPRILEFALAHRLATVIEAYPTSVPLGVLLSYGPQLLENARLAAGYVAKILKGAEFCRFVARAGPHQKADARNPRRRLRVGGNGPDECCAGQERIRRRAGENCHEIPASHLQPLDPTLGMDYGSTEPLPKGWTNGDFPPNSAGARARLARSLKGQRTKPLSR